MIDETNITSIDETAENTTPQAPKKSGKTKYCEKCRKSYDAINKVCPYCGHKNKYTALKVGIGVMVGGTILFGAIPDMIKDKDDNNSESTTTSTTTEANTTTTEEQTTIQITTSEITTTAIITTQQAHETNPSTELLTELHTEAPTIAEISLGKQNALKQAKNYINFTAFSYTSLISQLEFEGFSNEEAIYGADNCGADWNIEAAEKAKDYLAIYGMSRDGLKEQLLFEGFTNEQAEYALAQVGY